MHKALRHMWLFAEENFQRHVSLKAFPPKLEEDFFVASGIVSKLHFNPFSSPRNVYLTRKFMVCDELKIMKFPRSNLQFR